jgi:hypothetical protein
MPWQQKGPFYRFQLKAVFGKKSTFTDLCPRLISVKKEIISTRMYLEEQRGF